MRYAHVYRNRTSGGVEQYLRVLDRQLLLKHRMTILQMYLSREETPGEIEVETVGRGRILWIPVAIRQAENNPVGRLTRLAEVYRVMLQHYRRAGKGQGDARLSAARSLWSHRGGHLRFKTAVLSDGLADLLSEHRVDLLAVHWLFYDTAALLAAALRVGVPFVFIHHFDNSRLSSPEMQSWLAQAAGIGVVADHNLPENLRDRTVTLSDAVDTDFFCGEMIRTAEDSPTRLVLLPARIAPGKGHRDLLEAARILLARGQEFRIGFAGAVDSEPLYRELREFMTAAGLQERVDFLGEVNAEAMRELYARSAVIVLPSYSEGLSRVLLEAQAMQRPVVAYDCAGCAAAIVPDETGFLVKTGCVSDLADRIGRLLQNPAERLRLGICGRQFVGRQFSIPALVERHEVFYQNALARARA
jgi:glycosyltransferase involved in cell wall biosynthesis